MERKLCLDTSRWDGDIDLGAWKSRRGQWGVIIKAGGNEDVRYRDSQFANTYAKAVALGTHRGAYYYTTVTTVEEAKKDAKHFCDLLEGYDLDLPCYMDVEDQRQFALSRRQLTDVIKAFCDTVNERGRMAGLYTGGSAWNHNMYPEELRKYAIWIAYWKATWPTDCGDFGMWQQGCMRLSDGAIFYDDVPGCCDLDWTETDYPSIIKPQPVIVPEQVPGDAKGVGDMRYRAHVQTAGWMPQVRDGQTAGTEGYAKRLEAIELVPPDGVEIEALAHVQGWGNLFYEGITRSNVQVIGTTGLARRLEAIKLRCTKNATGKRLMYQGHVQGIGWMDPVSDGEWCGTRGKSLRLEAVRIWFE